MTSIPASRKARAITFAPRSWPSRPGFATSTLIFRSLMLVTITILTQKPPQQTVGPDKWTKLSPCEQETARGFVRSDYVSKAVVILEFDTALPDRKSVEISCP